jgi:DNA primase
VEGYFDVIGLHQAGLRTAVAVCGTALTPEHVELLGRLDCRRLTFLFDGDAAGVAAAGKAAHAVLPSGLSARVALLDGAGGKTDPDEFARKNGLAAVEALVADAAPLTEFLIDGAIRAHCGPAPADAAFEQRVAAFDQLRPYLELAPDGVPRSVFRDRIAKRIGIDPQAIGDGARVPVERPSTRPEPRREARALHVLGTAGLDALALLASFPALAEVAREEHFLSLYAGHELEALARALFEGTLAADALPARIEPLVTAPALNRVRKLLGPARPEPGAAEREFRKAVVEAKIEQLQQEIGRLSAEVARAGSPAPAELVVAMQAAARRRADLEKRRDGRGPG